MREDMLRWHLRVEASSVRVENCKTEQQREKPTCHHDRAIASSNLWIVARGDTTFGWRARRRYLWTIRPPVPSDASNYPEESPKRAQRNCAYNQEINDEIGRAVTLLKNDRSRDQHPQDAQNCKNAKRCFQISPDAPRHFIVGRVHSFTAHHAVLSTATLRHDGACARRTTSLAN